MGRIGELNFGEGGGVEIKIWWEGDLQGGFSQVVGISKLSARGRGLPPSPPSFPVGKPIYIYIYHSVSLCTDPPSKPQVLKNLSCPRHTKSPDNSIVLLMFNNNTYIDFRTAYKHS